MELSKQQTDYTKGIAIAMMLCLHLFNREYRGLFAPSLFVGNQPLSYYISLFCDCCVWIYCFCSGYGLYITRQNKPDTFVQTNWMRLLKYVNLISTRLRGREQDLMSQNTSALKRISYWIRSKKLGNQSTSDSTRMEEWKR